MAGRSSLAAKRICAGGSVDLDFFAGLGGTVDGVKDFLNGQAGFAGGEQRFVVEAGVGEVAELGVEHGGEVGLADEGRGGVGHEVSPVGEEHGRVPVAAAFGAHKRKVLDAFFDMGDEGGFDLHDRAVVEADLADGQVFDGVGFVVPVGPVAHDGGG